jgi:hypothetical protein
VTIVARNDKRHERFRVHQVFKFSPEVFHFAGKPYRRPQPLFQVIQRRAKSMATNRITILPL